MTVFVEKTAKQPSELIVKPHMKNWPDWKIKREQDALERQKEVFKAQGPNKEPNVDFVGRELKAGDCVIYHQRYFAHFAYGTILEESEWPFQGSVMVKALNPVREQKRSSKFREVFPMKANKLIKISAEELMLKALENNGKLF